MKYITEGEKGYEKEHILDKCMVFHPIPFDRLECRFGTENT